ncbi:hypothetical protein FHX80_111646 [Streptomyces brevispora]|uniref:Uncharacterized protein n=1 Tax=Streptomyces brevispora TaxID=887462 RepID=A0A561UV51_9ACTN|nr:hypothetical protein [Streptomyces brevispora]TWG03226.1 hypothetical protein FHX80_111646 [Streptomyces brevispora]
MSGGGYEADGVRLLPWTGSEGKPCYVFGDGTGYVSRMADGIEGVQLGIEGVQLGIEGVQLGMADDLLGHAADLLADRKVTGAELHFLASRLTESLRDVKRVAESRGSRLGAAGYGPGADSR